jgi:hypothetical protein
MAESARTPSYLTHQSDEKGRLETYVLALEGQIEGQKARLEELEAALKRKTEATTEATKEEGSEAECQRRVTCRRVQMAAAADPDDRGRVATVLNREMENVNCTDPRLKRGCVHIIPPEGGVGLVPKRGCLLTSDVRWKIVHRKFSVS